jgi:hypothetical protein
MSRESQLTCENSAALATPFLSHRYSRRWALTEGCTKRLPLWPYLANGLS